MPPSDALCFPGGRDAAIGLAAFDRDRFDDLHALLRLLLARGADPNIHGINDYTALHLAAERGDLEAVELLLAHGADPNEATRIDDYETALDLAAKAGQTRVAARLAPLTRPPRA